TQKSMDARREAQRISGISASRATKQTRFLGATLRDGAPWPHFSVARPRHTLGMPSGSRLELRPTRRRRMRESKSDRLPRITTARAARAGRASDYFLGAAATLPSVFAASILAGEPFS